MSFCWSVWTAVLELASFLVLQGYELVKFWFHQGFRDGRKRLPLIKKAYLTLPATELARMIREKKITSEELVKACIQRIRDVDRHINAVVDERFEDALEEAREADRIISTHDTALLAKEKPFLGVPITTKNCVQVKGLPTDIGNLALKGARASEDAVCIQRMRKAGAIPLALTNTPEMCLWIESANRIYGRTNNPFDIHRTCGGSSGGEAALVASCGSVWGIGTDLAGSIRLPAAWCGIFGHKPSPGFVTRLGVVPEQGREMKEKIAVAGPMAKSAEDLIAMMRIIADEPMKLRLDEDVDVAKLRYFFADHEGAKFVSTASFEVRQQVHRVVGFLQNEVKCQVDALPDPDKLSRSMHYWFSYIIMNGFPPLKTGFEKPQNAWDPTWELMRHASGHSDRTLYAIALSIMDDIKRNDTSMVAQDYDEFEKYKEEIYTLLGDDGILILPASIGVAPFHHGTLCNPSVFFGFAGLINILRLPSTVIPMGLDSRGIPLSVQVIAGHGNDRLTLAVARALEKKFGGFIPPSEVASA